MEQREVSVTFEPQGKKARVRACATVREAAARAGIFLDYPCGGQGNCGKCRVRIPSAAPPAGSAEVELLPPEDIARGVRLACQTRADHSLIVTIPETSLLATTYKILADSVIERRGAADPPARKVFLELPRPTLTDDCSDYERVERALGPVRAGLDMLQELPRILRACDFRGTAVLAGGALIDFEPGDTTDSCYVAAVDLGTTTLVASLVNVAAGGEAGRVSRMNPQTSFGDDVLSRILHTREHVDGLKTLQSMVVGAVNEMLEELARNAGIRVTDICELTAAGNTTMQHLFAGIDPGALGEIPFVPAVSAPIRIPARDAGVRIHARGRLEIFPVIGGFVGGDTVAGALAANIKEAPGSTLFIDIGTNGELVLHKGGELWATSCAAGPAFEGARITHGMRAAAGAIEKVTMGEDVQYSVIGGAAPVGLCGSALIDVAAELLRLEILLPQGLLLAPDQLPAGLSPALRERVFADKKGAAFTLARAAETSTGQPIVIHQADIRELQLAIAAIRAGVTIMLKRAGLAPEDLDQVLVAGAFGNYIRCENAQRIGLLPYRVPASRLAFIGNTSLAGARLAAVSERARAEAETLAREIHHVDLSLDPGFHAAYVEAMFFPEQGAEFVVPGGGRSGAGRDMEQAVVSDAQGV